MKRGSAGFSRAQIDAMWFGLKVLTSYIALVAADDEFTQQPVQLTTATFDEAVGSGFWLLEFYAVSDIAVQAAPHRCLKPLSAAVVCPLQSAKARDR